VALWVLSATSQQFEFKSFFSGKNLRSLACALHNEFAGRKKEPFGNPCVSKECEATKRISTEAMASDRRNEERGGFVVTGSEAR
jgi:hypothetical protein